MQCNENDGTCAEMAAEIKFKDRVQPEEAAKYKCEVLGRVTRSIPEFNDQRC